MKRYLSGSEATIEIDLIDRFDNEVNPTEIHYLVKDENGQIKVQLTPLMYDGTSRTVTVTVDGDVNTVAADSANELRIITLQCTTTTGKSIVTGKYVVEQDEPLIVGVNSFVTLDQAELLALTMPGLDWDMSTDMEKTAALMDSRERMGRLSFTLLDFNHDQSLISFTPETPFYVGTRVNSIFNINGSIAYMNAEQYMALPKIFRDAMAKAQVADAADTLSPDRITEMRRKGVILDTIGQTKQMFANSRPAQAPISSKAMGYLSRFLNTSLRIGRA